MNGPNKSWEENKRQISARSREYSAQLSEISRLFQRVVMNGSDEHRLELKNILAETKSRLVELIGRIDKS